MLTYDGVNVQNLVFNDLGGVQTLSFNNVTAWTARRYRVMTVHINQASSDPTTCCTYVDDAVDMTPGSAKWDEFFGHYPVMLNNGVEGQRLDPTNFAKHVDGTSANITTGADGDVMIAFPRRGLRISTSGNVVTVSMTDDPRQSRL